MVVASAVRRRIIHGVLGLMAVVGGSVAVLVATGCEASAPPHLRGSQAAETGKQPPSEADSRNLGAMSEKVRRLLADLEAKSRTGRWDASISTGLEEVIALDVAFGRFAQCWKDNPNDLSRESLDAVLAACGRFVLFELLPAYGKVFTSHSPGDAEVLRTRLIWVAEELALVLRMVGEPCGGTELAQTGMPQPKFSGSTRNLLDDASALRQLVQWFRQDLRHLRDPAQPWFRERGEKLWWLVHRSLGLRRMIDAEVEEPKRRVVAAEADRMLAFILVSVLPAYDEIVPDALLDERRVTQAAEVVDRLDRLACALTTHIGKQADVYLDPEKEQLLAPEH